MKHIEFIKECRNCGAQGVDTYWLNDGHGIPLKKVCDRCYDSAKSKYRPEIFGSYTKADVDEPIEPEE